MPKNPAPEAAPAFEAMASETNQRGWPYTLGDLVFPPGVWVTVTESQASQLRWFGWVEVREKEVG